MQGTRAWSLWAQSPGRRGAVPPPAERAGAGRAPHAPRAPAHPGWARAARGGPGREAAPPGRGSSLPLGTAGRPRGLGRREARTRPGAGRAAQGGRRARGNLPAEPRRAPRREPRRPHLSNGPRAPRYGAVPAVGRGAGRAAAGPPSRRGAQASSGGQRGRGGAARGRGGGPWDSPRGATHVRPSIRPPAGPSARPRLVRPGLCAARGGARRGGAGRSRLPAPSPASASGAGSRPAGWWWAARGCALRGAVRPPRPRGGCAPSSPPRAPSPARPALWGPHPAPRPSAGGLCSGHLGQPDPPCPHAEDGLRNSGRSGRA